MKKKIILITIAIIFLGGYFILSSSVGKYKSLRIVLTIAVIVAKFKSLNDAILKLKLLLEDLLVKSD